MALDWDRQVRPQLDMEQIADFVVERLGVSAISDTVRTAVGGLTYTPKDVAGKVEDALKTRLHTFVKELANRMSLTISGWYNEQTDELEVYPNGTRLVHRKGNTRIVVVEEEPRVRTLTFLVHDGEKPKPDEAPKMVQRRYTISLPYIVFTMPFVNGTIQEATVHFRPAPLKKLSDMLYTPALPNICANTTKVCWSLSGSTEWEQLHKNIEFSTGSTSMKIDMIRKYYWASCFTTNHWFDHFRWYQQSNEDVMGTLTKWQATTKSDRLFTLKIKMKGFKTLKDNVSGLVEDNMVAANKVQPLLSKDINTQIGELVRGLEKGLIPAGEGVIDSDNISTAVMADVKRLIQMACVYTAAEVERFYGVMGDDYAQEAYQWREKYFQEKAEHQEEIERLIGMYDRPAGLGPLPDENDAYFQYIRRRLRDLNGDNP